MVDRLLLATVVLTHSLVVAAFVLTDGPEDSPVVLKLGSGHGFHRSDVPVLLLWLAGMAACGALAWRHRPDSLRS